MSVKARGQVVCPDCRYRQKGERKLCGKCGRSLKGVTRDWWVFIDHAGRKKAKKVGARDAALEVAKKLEARLTLGDLRVIEDSPTMPTVEEYAKQWLSYVRSVRRETTAERYEETLRRHVLPVFKARTLDRIKRAEIRDFLVDQLGKGYAKTTVKLVRDIFSGLFAHAVEEELIAINPVSGSTKRISLEKDTDNVDVLTTEESALLLETCEASYSDFHPFFLCGLRTGMRLGEILAVKWSDIDWNSHFIVVQRSYRRGKLGLPKSGKARRVDMSDQLEATLKVLLQKKRKEALATGKGQVGEFVFCKADGELFEQNFIRRIFKRALKKAGLREIRIHDLRHTYASLLLSQGVSPVYVKEQMGHHSISITVDIYGRWITSGDRTAVNRLDEKPNETPAKPTPKETAQPVKIAPLS
jgi:integrase